MAEKLPKYVRRWLRRFDVTPRIDSLEYSRILNEVSVSVQTVLITAEITVKNPAIHKRSATMFKMSKTSSQQQASTHQKPPSRQPSYMLYRCLMLKLLFKPKPLFEQLCFELPCLMGFRAHEVCTWKAEWINPDAGECYVLDAKKHQLIPVSLSYQVAVHAEQLLASRREGLVLQNRSNAWKQKCAGKPISIQSLWHIWKKHTAPLGLPESVEISPLVGRRFYIALAIHTFELSPILVSKQVRHKDVQQTLEYAAHLFFIEDVKAQQRRFDEKLALLQREFEQLNEMENLSYVKE